MGELSSMEQKNMVAIFRLHNKSAFHLSPQGLTSPFMLSLIQTKKSTQPWWTRFCRQLTSWGVMPFSCLHRPSTDSSRSRMGRAALWLCDTRNKHRADLSVSVKDWMIPIIMHRRKGSKMTRMLTVIVTTSKFGKKFNVKYYEQQTLVIVHNRLMLMLMAFIQRYFPLLSRLTALACAFTWVTSFL